MRYAPPAPGEANDEWQAAHEPTLALRVWVLTNGTTMINVVWGDEGPDADKSARLDDMGAALLQVHGVVDLLSQAVASAFKRRAVLDPGVNDLDPSVKES